MRCLIPFLMAATPATADITVTFRDGNPHDRFWLHNGSCAALNAVITIDMTNSAGNVLIDTVRGGPGTKDPMPVAVEHGPLDLIPPHDGDRRLVFAVQDLPPNATGVITLDLDGDTGWWPAPNVGVEPDEMAGTILTVKDPAGQRTATFNTLAHARIETLSDCGPRQDPPNPVTPQTDLIS